MRIEARESQRLNLKGRTMQKLYFVSAQYLGQCVFGGHWLAESPADAKALALKAIAAGRVTSDQHGLRQLPPTDSLVLAARRSSADPAAMAMNAGFG